MSTAVSRWLRSLDRLWVIGRRSETAYLRFYPNLGFMVPWFGGRRLVFSIRDGLYIRRNGSRWSPRFQRYLDEQRRRLMEK